MNSLSKCSGNLSRSRSAIIIVLFIFSLVFISCGSGEGESTSGPSGGDPEAGAIRINLDWQMESSQYGTTLQPQKIVLNPDGTIDCVNSGIDKIIVLVLDQYDVLIQDNDAGWDCTDHVGTLDKVIAGIDRKIIVSGRDAAGTEICKGEATGITVISGGTSGNIRVVMKPVDPGPFTAPVVTTTAADPVTDNSATVNGLVNPNALATSYHFEYGPSTAYGTSTTSEDAGEGTSAVTVHHNITGLAPESQYHYRIVATNSAGTTYGNDMMFSTNPVTIIHTVTFSAGPNGSIIGNTPQSVVSGEASTDVEAQPEPHYRFVGWTGDHVGTESPLTITNVTGNMNITATFAPVTHTVTFSAGPNGRLSGKTSQVVDYGASTTAVGAIPDDNYRFVNWSGAHTGTITPLVIANVTGDMTVTANFDERVPFWITGTSPANSATDVRIDASIAIVFNQGINPATIAGTTLTAGATSIAYTTGYHAGTRSLTLDPLGDLPDQSDIKVELPATVTGYIEERFTGNRTFVFRTGTVWHDGNTVFVSPGGEAGKLGTKAQPLRSIQEAVDTAYAKQIAQVYVQEGNYSYSDGGLSPSVNVGLHITKPITIVGGWNPAFTLFSGANSILDGENTCDHVVHIQSSDVDLHHLTIRGGNADGPDFMQKYGGGLYIYNPSVEQSNILIKDSEISENTCALSGGGVYVGPRSIYVTIQDSAINSNTTALDYYAGGLSLSNTKHFTVDNVDFRNNSGQAIDAFDTRHLTITDSLFLGNFKREAIEIYRASDTLIHNNFIISDVVGIYLESSTGYADPFPNLTISSCRFTSNVTNSTTATAVREGTALVDDPPASNVHGHTITNNFFNTDKLANIYEDWDGTTLPTNASGIGYLNTAGHPSHGASTASGNKLY